MNKLHEILDFLVENHEDWNLLLRDTNNKSWTIADLNSEIYDDPNNYSLHGDKIFRLKQDGSLESTFAYEIIYGPLNGTELWDSFFSDYSYQYYRLSKVQQDELYDLCQFYAGDTVPSSFALRELSKLLNVYLN